MHFIKKTLFISTFSLFGIVLLQSSASAQVLEFEKELSFGDNGTEVSLLQEFLKKEGFFNEEVTGYFGPLTQEGVIRYQIENGVEEADGVFALEVKSAEASQLSNTDTVIKDLTISDGFTIKERGGKVIVKLNQEKLFGSTNLTNNTKILVGIAVYRKNSISNESELIKNITNLKDLSIIINSHSQEVIGLSKKKYLTDGFDQFVITAKLKKDNVLKEYTQFYTIDTEPTVSTEAPTLKIKKVKGLKGAYKPGEEIEYNVTAIKSLKNKKTLALPEEGYHIQARVMDSEGNQVSGVNTEYNADKKIWEVGIVPINVVGKYNIITSLYCGDTSKNCGLFDEEVEQFDLERKVNIRGKAVATTTSGTAATSTNATYNLTVENLNQANAAHNIKWSGSVVSSPVLQIKCESKEILYSTEDRKDVTCQKVKWNTIAEYDNQTSNVFTLAAKNGDYAKVSVRIGLEKKPKTFDEKVFIMPANRSLQTSTSEDESEDDTSDIDEDINEQEEEEDETVVPQTNTPTATTTNTTTISDTTHKCFVRDSIRSPWVPVKCSSKAFEKALKGNKMVIARKNTSD